ncbi:MAG TPA: pectinesterase family protein, partial [Bacteroidota bacterium]|nr:pectinesterase family protein [Bacteroidota bacterium]
MTLHRLIVSLLFFFTASAGAVCAAPITYTVAADGTGDYRLLQQAIDACPNYSEAGIIIRVKNGVYREKIVFPPAQSHITLIGENVDSV